MRGIFPARPAAVRAEPEVDHVSGKAVNSLCYNTATMQPMINFANDNNNNNNNDDPCIVGRSFAG